MEQESVSKDVLSNKQILIFHILLLFLGFFFIGHLKVLA